MEKTAESGNLKLILLTKYYYDNQIRGIKWTKRVEGMGQMKNALRDFRYKALWEHIT